MPRRPLVLPLAMSLAAALAVALGTVSCERGAPVPELPSEVLRANNLGTSYLGQQNWAEAEAAFRRGLELRPADAVLLNNVSIALQQQGRTDEAGDALRAALASAPEHPYVNYNLGLYEKNHGGHEAAIAHFERVVAHDDGEVFALYNLGAALSRTERTDEAERWLRRAVERDPTHISSVYNLGRLLLQTGREDEGAEWIERSQLLREQSALNEAMGSQYGEQGPYALGCDYPGGGLTAPDAIEVAFAAAGTHEGPCAVVARADEADAAPVVWTCTADERALVAVDLDDDGIVERVALRADGSIVTGEPGAERVLSSLPGAQPQLAFVDKDHDGDLDLLACDDTHCRIAIHDGSATFAWDPAHSLPLRPEAGPVVALGFSDLDNDRDIDLLVLQADAVLRFSNARDGSFDEVSAETGLGEAGSEFSGFAVADLNKDGWMDLVLAARRGLKFHENRRGAFLPGTAIPESSEAADGVIVADFDNDGLLDLASEIEGATFRWRNEGPGAWDRVPMRVDGPPQAAFDADLDGDLDVLTRSESRYGVWRNDGGNARGHIRLDPHGVGDNRFGIGTKLEILAGDLRQKFERTDTLPMYVGLGDRDVVDSVRMLWPGGVLQDELNASAGDAVVLTQLDRKGTSCPILYAWRDGGFRFVTDFLGGSAVGYLHAPGRYSTPDPDEIVLIEGGLEPVDGTLRLRLNNQLEEIIWFDRAELLVADHPDGSRLYPNERLMPGPPWPEPRWFAGTDVRPLAAARELETGRDVLERLSERDRTYADGFESLPYKGYATPHTLELDLGDWNAGTRAVLLLDGWIDYADSSANLAASQAGLALSPPVLEVADGRGGWRATGHRMGFPAGLPKTMTVEVGDLFPTGDHRVRISTNMRIYFDRARVMVGGSNLPLRVRRLAPARATLGFGGYPRPTSPDGKKPFAYDPEQVDTYGGWKTHGGWYTAFGDVRDRLVATDDRLVTTRHGDAVVLEYDAPPAPEPGFVRSYFLHAAGFGKDMDPNSAANDAVGPVPFREMPGYPYGGTMVPPADPDRGRGRFVRPDRR